MKFRFNILFFLLNLISIIAEGQTTWNLSYNSYQGNPVPLGSVRPMEWNNHYFIFHRTVISGTRPSAFIKKVSSNGILVDELESDSIVFLSNRQLVGITAIMDTALGIPRINLVASAKRNSKVIFYRLSYDVNLNFMEVDSLVCMQCSSVSDLYFGDIAKISSDVYLISGVNRIGFNGIVKLDFITGITTSYLAGIDPFDFLLFPFKIKINDTLFYGGTDYYPHKLRFFDQNLNSTPHLEQRFQPIPTSIPNIPCQAIPLKSERLLRSSQFLSFSFSDTARVGLLIQDRLGNNVDSLSIPSLQGSWFEFGIVDYLDTSAIFLGASQKLGFSSNPQNSHIEVHKVGLNRQKHWSVSLGRRPGYEILQIKATTDGGVLVYTRYFDQGVWFHELRKLDGQGNFLSQSEFPLQKAFSIYPNPAQSADVFFVDIAPEEIEEVYLYGLDGKRIALSLNGYASQSEIKLPSLSEGMYLGSLRLKDGSLKAFKLSIVH